MSDRERLADALRAEFSTERGEVHMDFDRLIDKLLAAGVRASGDDPDMEPAAAIAAYRKRRTADEPYPMPEVHEVDRILRAVLPSDMVFAIAPTGDPFTRWARAMLGRALPGEDETARPDHPWNDPDDDGHDCADCPTVSPWKCDRFAHLSGMKSAYGLLSDEQRGRLDASLTETAATRRRGNAAAATIPLGGRAGEGEEPRAPQADLRPLVDDLALYVLATPAPAGTEQEADRQRLIARLDDTLYLRSTPASASGLPSRDALDVDLLAKAIGTGCVLHDHPSIWDQDGEKPKCAREVAEEYDRLAALSGERT